MTPGKDRSDRCFSARPSSRASERNDEGLEQPDEVQDESLVDEVQAGSWGIKGLNPMTNGRGPIGNRHQTNKKQTQENTQKKRNNYTN